MRVIEYIIGSLVMIILLIGAWVIVNSSQLEQATDRYAMARQAYTESEIANNLDSILDITESTSERTITELLGDTVYYRSENLLYAHGRINSIEVLEALLNHTFGNGTYYFEIEPELYNISLFFVLDGGKSMIDERRILAENLPEIVQEFRRQNYKTHAEVLILANNATVCDEFVAQGIVCENVPDTDLYNSSMNPNPNLLSVPTFGPGEPSLRWFATEDWSAGVVYAAAKAGPALPSKIVMIFPISDESVAGSEAWEACKDLSGTVYLDCIFCESECPTEHRWGLLNRAADKINDTNFVVVPIQGEPYMLVEGLVNGSKDCENYLEACTNYGDKGYHCDPLGTPERRLWVKEWCEEEIYQQMDYLAKETGGQVIQLVNVADLGDVVKKVVQKELDKSTISTGVRREDEERYVVERLIPVTSVAYAKIRFWYYPEIFEVRGGGIEYEVGPKLVLVTVPVNWEGALPSSFTPYSDEHMDFFLEQTPLTDCPSLYRIIQINESCSFAHTPGPPPAPCSDPDCYIPPLENCDVFSCEELQFLMKVRECAERYTTDYDIVVGITDDDIYDRVGGFAAPGFVDAVVISEHHAKVISVHEIGHVFGLVDEYCWNPHYEPVTSPNPTIAPYTSYGRDCGSGAAWAFPPYGLTESDYEYCYQKFGSPVWCLGNENDLGGRCIMSFVNTLEPREFCDLCKAHLARQPQLQC
jgi:hypothetical protein